MNEWITIDELIKDFETVKTYAIHTSANIHV